MINISTQYGNTKILPRSIQKDSLQDLIQKLAQQISHAKIYRPNLELTIEIYQHHKDLFKAYLIVQNKKQAITGEIVANRHNPPPEKTYLHNQVEYKESFAACDNYYELQRSKRIGTGPYDFSYYDEPLEY